MSSAYHVACQHIASRLPHAGCWLKLAYRPGAAHLGGAVHSVICTCCACCAALHTEPACRQAPYVRRRGKQLLQVLVPVAYPARMWRCRAGLPPDRPVSSSQVAEHVVQTMVWGALLTPACRRPHDVLRRVVLQQAGIGVLHAWASPGQHTFAPELVKLAVRFGVGCQGKRGGRVRSGRKGRQLALADPAALLGSGLALRVPSGQGFRGVIGAGSTIPLRALCGCAMCERQKRAACWWLHGQAA